jgi:hypothetical protein
MGAIKDASLFFLCCLICRRAHSSTMPVSKATTELVPKNPKTVPLSRLKACDELDPKPNGWTMAFLSQPGIEYLGPPRHQ